MGTPRFAHEIVVLRARVDAWRSTKKRGARIPDALWEAAVELATTHGVYDVSRGLAVDHSKLKRLVTESEQRRGEVSVEFVELQELFSTELQELFSSTTRAPAVVEMRRADGASFRVELPEGRVDVLALAATFWGAVA